MRKAVGAACVAVLALTSATGLRASPATDAAARGARFIAQRQASTGAYFAPDTPADTVAEAILALRAGGVGNVDDALAYVREHGPERAADRPAYAGRIVMAVVATGGDPRDFGGFDHVDAIASARTEAGSYEGNVYANALAILGLAAAGAPVPADAVRYVRANQCADGGFAWMAGCAATPDTDTTAHTISALVASGVEPSDLTVSRAREWLVRNEAPGGGFGLEPGDPVNANSTGLALSAFAALGEERPTAVDALLSLQEQSGGFRYVASDDAANGYATVQAVPGVAGRAYPFAAAGPQTNARPAAASPAATRVAQAPTPSPRTSTPVVSGAPMASGSHRAGLVVRLADGSVRQMCVTFSEPEITGAELLERSGLEAEVTAFSSGVAVCSLEGKGCSTDDCFCGYPSFWGYWVREGDEWAFSDAGASDRVVRDGSLDGWSWGEDGRPPPPDTDLDAVCAAAGDESASRPTARPEAETAGGSGSVPFVVVGALIGLSGAALAIRRRRA